MFLVDITDEIIFRFYQIQPPNIEIDIIIIIIIKNNDLCN